MLYKSLCISSNLLASQLVWYYQYMYMCILRYLGRTTLKILVGTGVLSIKIGGLFGSVSRASDFGSEGQRFDSRRRRLRCEFYPCTIVNLHFLLRCKWVPVLLGSFQRQTDILFWGGESHLSAKCHRNQRLTPTLWLKKDKLLSRRDIDYSEC